MIAAGQPRDHPEAQPPARAAAGQQPRTCVQARPPGVRLPRAATRIVLQRRSVGAKTVPVRHDRKNVLGGAQRLERSGCGAEKNIIPARPGATRRPASRAPGTRPARLRSSRSPRSRAGYEQRTGRPPNRKRRAAGCRCACRPAARGPRGRIGRRGAGAAGPTLARAAYSWVSVLIVIMSPSLTKCGTWITNPVSIVAGFSVLVTAAFFIRDRCAPLSGQRSWAA